MPTDRVSVTAAALDARVDLDAVASALPWSVRRRNPYSLALAVSDEDTAYVYGFGAVAVESPEGAHGPLLEAVEQATGRRVLRESVESTWVRFDPEAPPDTGRVGWEGVALVERTPARMAAVALLLAQSAALERYEHAADRIVEEAAAVAQDLVRRGRPPQRTRALVRRLGGILSDRLALARWFYLVDRPEETWEKREVAALYDALFRNLELKERHDAMLHKLNAAETGLETTVNLWNGVWSLRLEWAIVGLIVVEIVLVLLGRF